MIANILSRNGRKDYNVRMKTDNTPQLGSNPVKSGLYDFLLAAFSGASLSFSFPDYGVWPFAWIGLLPLFAAIKEKSLLSATFLGWIMGLFYFGLSIGWVKNTITDFGHLPLWLAIIVNFLMVTVLALYTGLFSYIYIRIAQKAGEATALAFAPFIWVSVEFLRGNLGFLAFPWLRLADSQYTVLTVIQVADIAGEEGIGLLLVTINVALYTLLRWWRSPPFALSTFPIRQTAGAVFLLSATLAYGMISLSGQIKKDGEAVKTAIIQGNIDQARKWDRKYRAEQVALYVRETREAVANGAEFVVWPEASAPFYFSQESVYTPMIEELASSAKIPILFGAPGYEKRENKTVAFNRAWVVRPDGGKEKFEKVHLVPFGEYVPLKKILFFLDKVVTAIGDMEPGDELKPLDTGKFLVGAQVCYEIVFPAYSRTLAVKGANVIVNITNDSWYGRTAASRQSLAMAVFRAVENRKPVLRAAQTGISAIVRPDGSITGTTRLFEEAILYGEFTPMKGKTVYNTTGDILSYMCIAFTLFGLYFWRTGYSA